MLQVLLEGGFIMFFLLGFGLAALLFAARFALSPSGRLLRVTMALAAATFFTTCCGFCVDLHAVGLHAPDYLKAHPQETMTTVLLQGVAESTTPGILGFTLLSLVALLIGFGWVREVRI